MPQLSQIAVLLSETQDFGPAAGPCFPHFQGALEGHAPQS